MKEQSMKSLQEENNRAKLNFESSMHSVNSETMAQGDKLKKVILEN
jgi:hypothetical protein